MERNLCPILPAGTAFAHAAKPDHTVFAYVIEGECYFDPGRDAYDREAVGENYFDMARPCTCDDGTLVVYGPDGDTISITTEARSVRFLLISGKPLHEPVAWYGPIVMNSRAELRTAFEELEKGIFIKHHRP